MRCVSLLTFALAGAAASAAALPASTETDQFAKTSNQLDKRQGHCHDNMLPLIGWDNKLLCLGKTTMWVGAAITAIGTGTVESIAGRVTDWISSSVVGEVTASAGRLTRRKVQTEGSGDGETVLVRVDEVEVGVPFVRGTEGKTTIDILDFLTRSSQPSLSTRDVSTSEATVVGGSATFHSNGTLDNFTIDFSIPSSSYLSNSTSDTSNLAKRDYWALHTTYWAGSGHGQTALNWNEVHSLALSSYRSLPRGASQVCGYMANSGTWHGAFRHWTGDNGYQVGNCESERSF
ncbi:hypothetical protein JCM5350_001087 [Sporobolomyces pararoseus]